MTSSINAASPASPTTTPSPAKGALDLSSADFIKILVAQYQHQDPFEPVDPTQSLGQLAALAQLSTLQDIQGTLQQLLATRGTSVDASGWIGYSALVPASKASPMADGSYAGTFQTASDTDVELSFFDGDGHLLHSTQVPGPIKVGDAFSWDGAGADYGVPVTIRATSMSQSLALAVWTPEVDVAQPGETAP